MKFTDLEAFVIHSKAFREKQRQIVFLSDKFGKFSVLATQNKKRSMPKLFELSKVSGTIKEDGFGKIFSWFSSHTYQLNNKVIFYGLYINEFVYKVFRSHQPSAKLFNNYRNTLSNLAEGNFDLQYSALILRKFEWLCFKELGIAPDLKLDKNNMPIEDSKNYVFRNSCLEQVSQANSNCISGLALNYYASFFELEASELQDSESYELLKAYGKQLRDLNRGLLKFNFGHIDFASRKLFVK